MSGRIFKNPIEIANAREERAVVAASHRDDDVASFNNLSIKNFWVRTAFDEIDADLVGLELAARGAYRPQSAVSLWEKMGRASGNNASPGFLSTHPRGPERIARLQENIPRVQGLFEQAAGQR